MASRDEEKNKKSKKFQKSYFDVLGICCSSEIPLVENILKSLDGVKEFSIIVPSKTVIVVHDSLLISQHQIAKALNQARLEANVRLYGETNFKKRWPSPFAVASGVLLVLSFLKYVYAPLHWLAVGAVAAGIFPIVAKAFASIRRFRLDINILVIIAVVATMAMQDYTEAGAIVFLFTIAEWLESRAGHKASAVMLSLMSLAPQKAVIAETGEEVEVDEVQINTIIAVKAGETIPIDGVVVDGNCEVDEKTLTGEPFPVSKQRDSTVWAGTINLNGYISVRTTALAEDCVVAKMANLVEEAQNSKTKTQRFIDKCSQYYTPAVVVISACFAVVPVAMRVHDLKHWFHLALVVLVSACPCGLILSTPVATFCALTKAATSGLLIKGGDYLETLSKIKIAAFDKTGTITRGEFVVGGFESLSQDISLRSLLYWVSSIESKSSHPMAAALVDYAKSISVEPSPDDVEDYQNFPGEGIYGKIDGKDVYVGNKRIAFRVGCSTAPEIEVDTKGGKTVGYIYVGETLAGVFNLSDACRSGVAQAINELKSLGIKTVMLTGDNQASALHAQEQLGNALEAVHAELLPEDKAKAIKEFKKEGPTAMVGDGLNDAPALATADIGISMGISGSALATETGHIILMSNDIRKIPNAIKLARRAHRKVMENVVLSITLKGGILVLAFAGHPLIWAAVLADVGTCLLVILNSMLLLREKHKAVDKCYRASSSVQKLKGDGAEDMGTGMLPKNGDGHCDSGCCGKNNQEKKLKPADTVEVLQRNNNGHCHSSCCDETLEEKVKLVGQSCCEKPAELGQGQGAGIEGHCNSGCCGDKNQDAEQDIILQTPCEKHTHSEKGLQMKSSSDCKEGCAGKTVKINIESNSDCESGCCGQKGQVEKKIMTQTSSEKPAELEQGLLKKTGGNCKSGCCGDEEKAKGKAVISGEYSLDVEKGLQMKKEGNCKSGCCSSEKQAKETSWQKAATSVVDFQRKDSISGGCCGNKGEVKQSCHEKPAEPDEVDLGIKRSGDCKSVCCGHTEKAMEESDDTKQCSSAKPVDLDDDKNCKSSCCPDGHEKAKAVKESCCSKPPAVKKDDHCKTTCCEDKAQSMEESCCSVVKSKRHHHHTGGNCCRSYAKECCRRRHIGASGFGGLTEIIIE